MRGRHPGDETMRLRARMLGALMVLSAGLVACKNPQAGTARGPTKAPGDTVPVFFIHHEEPTAMRALGQPNRPSAEPLAFPDLDTTTQAAAPAAAAPAATKPAAALPAGVTQAMVDEGKKVFDGTCF